MSKVDVSPVVAAAKAIVEEKTVEAVRTYGIICVFGGTKDLSLTFNTETKRDAVAKAIQNTRGNLVGVRADAREGTFLICTPAYVRILD